VVIRAVMFDFGGVISTSPFEAFARLETEHGLPPGFIRSVNATNPDRNAWAQLERGEIGIDAFGPEWAAEARALGHEVDGRIVLERLGGEIRPQMVAAIKSCRTTYKTACLTNNFGSVKSVVSDEVAAVYTLFDAVLESRVLGVRKPDRRFYELACSTVGVEPQEVVFLDDLGINLKPARALGMRTIKVTDPHQALMELEQILEHPL
jgi:putative hydrolase of the HAD superfamily